MIVVQGSAEIQNNGGSSSTFEIVINNEEVEVERESEVTALDNPTDSSDPSVKFDASDIETQMTLTIHAKTEGVSNFALTEAIAVGKTYVMQPPSLDVAGLPKEEYLKEIVAFGSAQVDSRSGMASWVSPLAGEITCFAESTNTEKDCLDTISLTQNGEDLTFKIDARKLFGLFNTDNIDYLYCDMFRAKGAGTIDATGEVGTVEFEYRNSDYSDVVHGVSGLSSSSQDFVTFDTGIHMAAGWLDGMDIPYQRRSLLRTSESMYKPLFYYLFFSAVSPTYFMSRLDSIAMCGKLDADLYNMPWVITNNTSFTKSPAEVSVTVRGPDVSGEATVSSDTSLVSFDTENVETLTGRVLLDLTIEGSQFGVSTFEAPCGVGKGEFVSSAVDCKIATNTISNTGNRRRSYEASVANLNSFHHFINGLENALSYTDYIYMVMGIVFGLLTRGLSCIFTSNSLQFIYYLIYEQEKMILSDSERNSMMSGIVSVHDRHNAALGGASTNVPKGIRKEMSKQYLETISQSVFRQKRNLSGSGVFTWFVFCIPIVFNFPRYLPWMPTAPDIGVPLEVNILENAEKENGVLTDDHIAMMKKNMGMNIFETRVDWILKPLISKRIKSSATAWFQMGETVVLKRDGRHQEFYAIDDPGYMLGDYEAKDHPATYVSIHGSIGDKWNEWKEEVVNGQGRFTHMNNLVGILKGNVAEDFVENMDAGHSAVSIFTKYGVLDMTNETFIREGETINVKLLRPNKDVIIALKK